MILNKIPVPENTCLVEVISDANEYNHCIYFLDERGDLIDYLKINECTIYEIIKLINHMFIIHMTDEQVFEMKCITSFNNIFEPDYVRYDDIFSWQLSKETLKIIRHFGKLKNVLNYSETDEFRSEAHIIDDFIFARPTPIERESEEVHQRGIVSRKRMLEIIKNWVY